MVSESFSANSPFVANEGGYLTLSFIPTLGTMILGLIAGRWLRADAPRHSFRRLLIAGVAGVAAGLLLHVAGICPVVKRIWTPSWTLFSGGVCFLMLAGFAWIIEAKGYRKWAFPLVVIGMNSIAAYLIAHLLPEFPGFLFPYPFGAPMHSRLPAPRCNLARRHGHAAGVLDDSVLDVSPQNLPAHMNHQYSTWPFLGLKSAH